MPSLLDDPWQQQNQGATSLVMPPLQIQQPDPNQPTQAQGLVDVYNKVMDAVARQRQIAADQGLWNPDTGMPTGKGLLDAANQYGSTMLLGTETPGIRAYHGSPYSFEQFDPAKIGTGEGAQAYGHGLYFAENEGTAQSYRDALSRTDYSTSAGGMVPDWVGNSIKQIGDQFGTDSKLYGDTIDRHIADFQERLAQSQKEAQGDVQPWLAKDRAARQQEVLDSLQGLRSGDATLQPRGSMYEVNLQADPEHFLDWDKPLSEQSQHVQDALSAWNDRQRQLDQLPSAVAGPRQPGEARGQPVEPSGQSIYKHFSAVSGNDFAAGAKALQDAGIPGIKYLDAGSRGQGEGTSNYVVFSPDIINIIRKYGIAGLIGGGAAAAAATGKPQS